MTFGELDKSVPEHDTQEGSANWVPFDWRNESYQLACREYRLELGITNPRNYESKYYTASEHRYWKNLYKIRGYGPYEGRVYFNGKKTIAQVIPDPPGAWIDGWTKKRGISTKDAGQEKLALSKEQQDKCEVFLKRLDAAALRERQEVIAIPNASLLSEFQIWLAEEDLGVTEEMAQLMRDSWARIFAEERKAPGVVRLDAPCSSSPYTEVD
jgi:hypothetical protein